MTEALARRVLDLCRAGGLRVATAESCTGGMVAAALTEIAGSSDVVEAGLVTYSNQAKTALLGVPEALIARVGAVSDEVARAMVAGVLARTAADLAVAVTGIAGPGGATPTKPVGLVFLGLTRRGGPTRTERHVFAGERKAIRAAATVRALELLAEAANGPS